VTLERRAGGYVLEAPPESSDVLDFGKLTAQAAQAGDDERAESLLRATTGLWRGRALDGVTSPWLERARAGLEQEWQAATLHLYRNRHAEDGGTDHRPFLITGCEVPRGTGSPARPLVSRGAG
jgi:hypothetical protein